MTVHPAVIGVGTDGVGKTPIMTAVARELGLPYFKFQNEVDALKGASHPGQHMLWFDYGLTQVMRQTGFRFASDRGYLCELVYSAFYRRKTDKRLLEEIDAAHAELGTIIVWLYDSRISESAKDDEHVPRDHIPRIQELYAQVVGQTMCRTVSYDVTTSALCETIEQRAAIDVPNVLELIRKKT